MENKKGKKMNKMILVIITLIAVVTLGGCNTVKGIGNDIAAVGGWITSGSEHVEESVKSNPPGSKMNK